MSQSLSISFIIPYYKIERKLLDRAIQSVRRIEMPPRAEWELILVDDGTPDSHAAEWIAEYADPRLRYIRRENGGLSEARNTGIDAAKMDYIQFLDADDYFFRGSYERIARLLDIGKPDVIMLQRKKVFNEEERFIRQKCQMVDIFPDGLTFMRQRSFFAGAWGYTFRRAILAELRFIPGIYHEDEDFTPRLFARAGKLIVSNTVAYAYYQRTGSIINSPDEAKAMKRIADRRFVLAGLRDWTKTATDGKVKKAVERRYEQVALSVVYELLREAPSATVLRQEIDRLREMGCYPLPKRRYTHAYSLFRILTDRRWKIVLLRFLLRQRK